MWYNVLTIIVFLVSDLLGKMRWSLYLVVAIPIISVVLALYYSCKQVQIDNSKYFATLENNFTVILSFNIIFSPI